jgi:hypothetical protein
MCILMIVSRLNKTIHTSKISRIVLKRIFIIPFLLKRSCVIMCRFSSKRCSVSSMHKPYIILNEICITLVCSISLTIPSYTSIVMLLPSNSRSTVVRFICKLTHYIIVRSITITISV